nr:hypothetical protein [Nocardia yunnanensis]
MKVRAASAGKAADTDKPAKDDEDGPYIFSAENGDDWFYFEDSTSE